MVVEKLKSFEPVYVINLDRQTSRRAYIEKHFKQYGVTNYQFVSAVDGTGGRDQIDALLHPQSQTDDLRDPEIAVIISHLKAIKHWLETSDTPYAIFCEDDVDLQTSRFWDFSWEDFIKSIRFRYDIIQMSITNPVQIPFHQRKKYKEYSAGCYLITRHYAMKLIKTYFIEGRYKIYGRRRDIVADELIYNTDRAYSVGLFTYRNKESNINPDKINGAHERSINTVMNYWKENKSIPIGHTR